MDYIGEKESNSGLGWCNHGINIVNIGVNILVILIFGHLRLWSFSILGEVVIHYGQAHFQFW